MANREIILGNLSIFVNLPRGVDEDLTRKEQRYIEELVVEQYSSRLGRSKYGNIIRIADTFSRRGCVVVTITLVAVAGGIASFVKDYPKYREGLIAIGKDIGTLSLKLRGQTYKKSTFITDERIRTETRLLEDEKERDQ